MPYKCGFLTLFQTISTSNGNPPCGSIGPPCLMHIKFGKTIDHGGYESPAEIKYGMVLAWPYSSNFIHVYVFYNGSRSFLKPPISGFSRRYTNIGCSIAHPRSSQTNINKLCQFLEIHTRFQGRVKARGGTWRSFPIVGRGSDCGEPLLGTPDVGTQNE